MSINPAEEAKKKFKDRLLAIPGVTGVGYNGSVIVYVDPSTSPKALAFIPKSLDGIKVDVRKARFKTLANLIPAEAVYPIRTNRFRPTPGGVSIGHYKVTAGTLCMARSTKSGDIVGLTNNHIAALRWGTEMIGKKGDPILQPGPYDGGNLENDILGYLDSWVDVRTDAKNLIDAATFSSDHLDPSIADIGKPTSTVEPYVGQSLVKSGRTSGVNYTRIIDVDADIKVEGNGLCQFQHQIITEPACLFPGDSGSWAGDSDSFANIGLGHAGDDNLSAFSRMSYVESLLNLEVIPPLPYIPLKVALAPFAVAGGAALFPWGLI